MMDWQTILTAIARQGLTALGAFLVTQGLVGASSTEAIVGLAPVLASLAWSLYNKYVHAKVAVAATNAGVNVPAVKAAPMQTALAVVKGKTWPQG